MEEKRRSLCLAPAGLVFGGANKKNSSIEIRKWRVWTTVLLATVLALFFAGMEVLLTLIIRAQYRRGVSWPVTLIGAVAAALLIIGYTPVTFELWKRRGRVVGIDFGFLTIDWFGAFFSLMAIGGFFECFTPLFEFWKGWD